MEGAIAHLLDRAYFQIVVNSMEDQIKPLSISKAFSVTYKQMEGAITKSDNERRQAKFQYQAIQASEPDRPPGDLTYDKSRNRFDPKSEKKDVGLTDFNAKQQLKNLKTAIGFALAGRKTKSSRIMTQEAHKEPPKPVCIESSEQIARREQYEAERAAMQKAFFDQKQIFNYFEKVLDEKKKKEAEDSKPKKQFDKTGVTFDFNGKLLSIGNPTIKRTLK